jgi:SAM-dependent methyltransferase
VREDRKMEKTYFGNDFKIAELTYLNYIDPFDIESLWMESSGYFTKSSGATANIYNAPNKYKRFVVSTVLRDNLSNTKWIIDEASGRGADLHRYQQIGVENAIFMDVDPVGIAELVRRKFEFFAAKGGRRDKFLKKGGSSDDPKRLQFVTAYDKIHGVEYDKLIQKDVRSLTIHTMVLDLKTPADIIRDRVLQFGVNVGGVDGIVCNFALHYLCDTTEHLRNIIEFNSRMLKVGGVFIFTVMSGEKVLQLLRDVPKGGQWEVREGELAKYTIKRLFDSPTLAAAGQMISVRLPFTDQLVDEPLCNIANVVKVAGTYGFELESDSCLDVYLDQFKQANRELHDKLTADDIAYIKLHHFITLRKKREAMKKTGGGRVVGRRTVRK